MAPDRTNNQKKALGSVMYSICVKNAILLSHIKKSKLKKDKNSVILLVLQIRKYEYHKTDPFNFLLLRVHQVFRFILWTVTFED